MKDVVIVSAVRTAIGAYGKTLKDVPAVELGAVVIKEAVKEQILNQRKLMKLSLEMSFKQALDKTQQGKPL